MNTIIEVPTLSPLEMHTHAVKVCAQQVEERQFDAALITLKGVFTNIANEVGSAQIKASAKLQFFLKHGLADKDAIPLIPDLFPESRDRYFNQAAFNYRGIFMEAYRLGGQIYQNLDQYAEAARCFFEESRVIAKIGLKSPDMCRAYTESIFAGINCLIQNLQFPEAEKALGLAKANKEGMLDTPSYARYLQDTTDYLKEVKFVQLRFDALENSILKEPQALLDYRESLAALSKNVERQTEQGRVFPRALHVRMGLSELAADFQYYSLTYESEVLDKMLGTCQQLKALQTDKLGQQLIGIFTATVQHMANPQGVPDVAPFVNTSATVASGYYYPLGVAAEAAASFGVGLAVQQQVRPALVVLDWLRSYHAMRDRRVSPMAAKIALGCSDLALSDQRLDSAETEASTALHLARMLHEKKVAGALEINAQAQLRLGIWGQHSFNRVPQVVDLLTSLPHSKRNQLDSYDVLVKLRDLQMGTAWNIVAELYRDMTGCDRPLSISGHKVPGLRVIASPEQLDATLSQAYRDRALRNFCAARFILPDSEGLHAEIQRSLDALLHNQRSKPDFKPHWEKMLNS